MRAAIKVLILLFVIHVNPLYSQNISKTIISDLITQGERISELMMWDSAFNEQLTFSLQHLNQESKSDSFKNQILEKLLQHYKDIKPNNKSRVKLALEESVFSWIEPLIGFIEDPVNGHQKIINGFPDTYFPTKILAPELLNDESLRIMAEKYPKEVMNTARFMIDPDVLKEIEIATLNAPNEAKQYLHYTNNINSAIKSSTNQGILKIMEIYAKYRYGSNSYYLIDPILNGNITIEEAETITQNKENLYNALIATLKNKNAIGKYSAIEMLTELSDKYARRLMFQRYSPASTINMDALNLLTFDSKVYFLFSSHDVLTKKDLQNLVNLYNIEPTNLINESIMEWIPIEWINKLEKRIVEEKLQAVLSPLIDPELWVISNKKIAPVETPLQIPIEEVVTAYVFTPYIINLSESKKELIKLENNPLELLKDLSKVTGKFYSRIMLLDLAKEYPIEVMAQLDKFKTEPYSFDICRELAKSAPLTVKNFLIKKDHEIHYFLKNSKDTTIATLYHIDEALGSYTRAYILLDKIVKKELTYMEADSICKDKQLLLPQLIDVFIRNEYLGAYTIKKELEYISLDFIRNFNISENTDHEFSTKLHDLDAKSIYTFLVFGVEEIISKTFSKMFDRLSTLINEDYSSLLKEMNYKYADRFLRMAIHYGKENELFRHIDNSEDLLSKIFKNLENVDKSKLQESIEAADIIVSMGDKKRLESIQNIIKSEYERLEIEKNDEGVATYGILASLLSQHFMGNWSSAASVYFKIPNLNTMPLSSLLNGDLINVQQYYFYDDVDGVYSYNNFLKQYEASDFNWKIDDLGLFIKIASKSGKAVLIFANKPREGDSGITALENYLKANHLSPQILVHRGLSTHTLKTFNKVPSSTKLILDGSCGGFHIQSVALANAPGAQILCNRNIGTMQINDPLFKQISESIRQGKDIVWPSFWSEMEARLGTNPYFNDYIPPHKNIAALILKAYYDVLDIN